MSEDLIRMSGQDGQTPKIYNDMNFNTNRAKNLKDPVEGQDAVTLNYFNRWLERYLATGQEPGDRI